MQALIRRNSVSCKKGSLELRAGSDAQGRPKGESPRCTAGLTATARTRSQAAESEWKVGTCVLD